MKILHVVCTYPSKEKPFEQPFTKAQVDSLTDLGLDIHVLNIKGYESKTNYFKATKQIKRLVNEKKIDLIHAHYSYAGLSSLFSNSRKPILISLMGSDLLGVPNKDGNLTLRGRLDSYLTNFLVKKVDRIIVKSERMKKQVKAKVPIHVIPNGVNYEHFKPYNMFDARKKTGLSEEKFYVLFLGNPKLNRKNFLLAKNSVDLLESQFGVKNVELLCPFGISSSEVVDYMNGVNVLLQTSYWEGSPNVVKEAMACNLPVITTDVGDVKEVISNTERCYIVPFNSSMIANKINEIKNNYSRSNGRENIEHLQLDIIANKIKNVYDLILG